MAAYQQQRHLRGRRYSVTRAFWIAGIMSFVLIGLVTHIMRGHGLSLVTLAASHGVLEAEQHIALEVEQHLATMKDDSYCARFPDPGNIAVVVKTGATELHARVPVLLDTALRCVERPILVSDLDQKLGHHHVHDALATIPAAEVKYNPDFDLYRLQQEYVRSGREKQIHELRKLPAAGKLYHDSRKAGWHLDKYKFLPMISKAWELAPEKDWYFFMDADTYLNWPNLLRWLPQLDPRKKLYIGHLLGLTTYPSEAQLWFAHGGAGILLSRAAVEEYAKHEYDIAQEWLPRVEKMWLGDAALGAALAEELDLYLTDAHMSMTENEPNNTAFETQRWCRPLLTMHHVKTELPQLATFDAQNNGTALFRDLSDFIYADGSSFPRWLNDWDNQVRDDGTWDWGTSIPVKSSFEKAACPQSQRQTHSEDPHCSFEACERACANNPKCMQFLFRTQVLEGDFKHVTMCSHSDAYHMGRERKVELDWFPEGSREVGARWQSGWMTDRIVRWIAEHRECRDEEIVWPGVS